MITEDYVSFETAKLLKEKGFEEWCFKCYGVAVLHNGVDISFDEECDLKDEGRENEIEYVEGGRFYDYGCNNREKALAVWAAPTLWAAMKWLREVHGLNVYARYVWKDVEIEYGNWEESVVGYDWFIESLTHNSYLKTSVEEPFRTCEEACEVGIKYCLENLI